jgi:glyoxylase-like metal-dependent hydrolase (beta-lactamase superfamily II)
MMGKAEAIAEGIYIIGGPNISHSSDATSFIIEFETELVMIDSGAGKSFRTLVKNIEDAGLDPHSISMIILTHCHIDHIGSAPDFKNKFGCTLVIHEGDAAAVEQGDQILTASNWYDTVFPPTPIGRKLTGDHEVLKLGNEKLHCIHTPGHTPGSIAVYIDRGGERILFGQDIHGPFLPSFGSDIQEWKKSMQKLLDLEADILCEGHFGIFRSRAKVEKYIKDYLRHY